MCDEYKRCCKKWFGLKFSKACTSPHFSAPIALRPRYDKRNIYSDGS